MKDVEQLHVFGVGPCLELFSFEMCVVYNVLDFGVFKKIFGLNFLEDRHC